MLRKFRKKDKRRHSVPETCLNKSLLLPLATIIEVNQMLKINNA